MAKYLAKVLVTYTVVADSEAEAREVLQEGMEHPLLPYESGWCEADEIISIKFEEN